MRERSGTPGTVKRRGGPRWLLFGCGGVFAVALAAGFGYLAWANAPLPTLDPSPTLPDPNGRDVVVAAVANRAVAGKDSPLMHPDTSPTGPLREALAQPDPASGKVRAALAMEYRNPAVFDFTATFPEIPHFRDLARRWTAEARFDREGGKPFEAMDHCLDAMELGSRIPHGGGVLHHLVGVACQYLPLYQAEQLIPDLSEEEARSSGQRLDRIIRQSPQAAEALEVERRGGLTWARATFSGRRDALQLNGLTASPFSHPLMMAFYPKPWSYHNMEGYYRECIAEAKKPFPSRMTPEVPRDPFCMILLPAFNNLSGKITERDATLRLLRLELALQEFRMAHGQYPERLEALTSLPAEMRIDPFTTQPLVYRTANGRYELYSLGADGKDDGGKAIANRKQGSSGPGDIVAGKLKEKD